MKRIKTIALLLVALFVAQGAVAQKRTKTVVQTDSTEVVTIVKTIPKFSPKHDIRVGVGTVSLPTLMTLDSGWGYDDYYLDFRRDMANADTYLTPRNFVGNYSLTYTYQDRRWLQYGGQVIFGASTRSRRDVHTNGDVENLNLYVLSVMPTVRFSWFYREAVQMYSSVSLGIVTDFDEAFVWGDATLFGCSFGRKFFGFAEIGLGMSGWLRAGIGYRFNSVKK
jgi:hypothetical protein